MHSFHFITVVLYTCCIVDIQCNVASVIFPVHRPLLYYSLRFRRGHCMSLSLLWEQCIAAYLREVFTAHSNSEGTVKSYASVLRGFFRHTGKAPELCTREDVVSFMAASNHGHRNHGLPPSPGTRLYRKTGIHQFYVFAARYTCYDGYGRPYKLFVGENPADGLHQRIEESRPRYLTQDEIRRFFAAIDTSTLIGKRDYALFLTLLSTARRKTEIASLMWGDLSYGTVTDERGNHPGWIYKFRGKGRETWDEAELPEVARLAIWDYLNVSCRMATIEPDDYIFKGIGPEHGGSPRDPYARTSAASNQPSAKRYAKLAGIDPARVTVHAFSHTSAKHRLDLGQDIFTINKLLRHNSIDMTLRHVKSKRGTGHPDSLRPMDDFRLYLAVIIRKA